MFAYLYPIRWAMLSIIASLVILAVSGEPNLGG